MTGRKRHILFELTKADYTTVTATVLISLSFWLVWLDKIYLAIGLAFISMFLDYLDGALARKYGGSPYGKVLDSLYDILGWSLFPSLIINIYANWHWLSILITTTYMAVSLIRLSRFTVMGYVEKEDKYYIGLPVLFSKYALLLVFWWNAMLSLVIIATMIPLTISSIPIKKPHPFWAQIELVYGIIFILIHFVYG